MRNFKDAQSRSAQSSSPFGFFREIRLVLRLLRDERVSLSSKLIIPTLVGLYVLWPVDLLPDMIPFVGQLDDLTLLILGAKLFVDFCPQELVRQHRASMSGRARPQVDQKEPAGDDDTYIDADYKVIE